MATYIDNIVKFHTFSKSPVSKDTTLGGAVNPSGHTVTTSQVRAQDIPAFLNTFQGTKEQAITWLGNNYPTPAHNDIVFYGGEFKAGFSTPKCLKWNAKLETPAWEDFDITTAATLKNADDKDVIAVHQNLETVFVDGSNNAATNSNRNSLFVKKADGSILDHFVASTDKIVAGMPSLGYNALVLWNGAAIDEGELEANYIGNTFAGIVHLNKQYSTGDDANFKVTCFEYIGDKLDTALSDIDGKIQDIVGTTMEGVVASVGTTTAATNAGISVDSSTKTSPKIDINTGTIGGDSDAKLVTGSTVKTYVDTTALAEGGSIAEYIESYVATNAKVSVNGQSATTITVAGTAEGAADLVHIKVTEDKTTTDKIGLTLTATLDEAVLNEDGSIDKDGVVIATIAKDIAESVADTAINDAITTDNGAIKDAIDSAISDATLGEGEKIATTTDTTKLVTVEDVTTYVSENAKVTLTQGTGITVTPNGEASTAFTIAVDDTVATTQSVTDLTGRVTTAEGEIDALQTAVESITTTTIPNAITTAKTETLGTTITTATGKDDETAPKVTVQLSGTVQTPQLTVTTADIASAQALAALEQTVTEHITNAGGKLEISVPDGGTLPTTGEAGKIYLIPNNGEEEQNIYDEFVWTNGKWEKIGSTKVDLTDYVTKSSLTTTLEGYLTTADKTTLEGQITAAQTTANEAKTAAQTAQTTAESKVAQSDYDTKVAELEEAIYNAAPTNYITSINGSTGAKAITIKDGRETVYENDLWGTTVTMDTNGVITVDHKYLSNPNASDEIAWNSSVKSVKDNKAYTSTDATGEPLCNIQTEMIKDGSTMFYATHLASFDSDLSSLTDGYGMFEQSPLASFNGDLSSLVDGTYMFSQIPLESFSGDLSSLVNGNSMFYQCLLKSFNGDLSSLVNGQNMFAWTSLTSFNGDLSSLVNGQDMFHYCNSLTSFNGDLSSLVKGNGMFGDTKLESFSVDLSSLVDGTYMFEQSTLTSFNGDLSSLVKGNSMFMSGYRTLTSFNGDLSSLVNGYYMFRYAKLDTESVECIADTIRNVKDLSGNITGSDGETYAVDKRINIGIANETPNEAENAAFWIMHNEKGWSVYVNDSQISYNPTEPTAIATLDENGEEVVTPIPFWAKPFETDEEHAEYVGEDGKFYQVVGGQFIYVSDPETYGQFTSLADAVANMRLTKYEKPQEEA